MILQITTIATSITLASIPIYGPSLPNSILEKQVSQSYTCMSDYLKYKFDGRWAQQQHEGKRVSYYNDGQNEEGIIIYRPLQPSEGILTTIFRKYEHSKGETEKCKVRVIKQGTYPWEALYETIEEIPVSEEENERNKSFFIFYKWLLLEQKNK